MIRLIMNAAACAVFLLLSMLGPGWLWAALAALGVLTLQAFHLFRQSRTDDLTGLWNLRRLKDMELFYRRCPELGVWFFDLDHLKQVNDTEGHTAGDRLLMEFASALRDSKCREAMAYRVGGDEFLLILPRPQSSTPPLPDVPELPASWGFAEGDGRMLRELIVRAEQEMYRKRRSC